jgi:ABC-type Zn uptake system ZnuABC Zn-binding protein ZnuA
MSSAEGPLQLVTTSNIVGDWVLEVGGEQVEVSSLQPIGADPRTFQPSQEDIDRVAKADVIFSVGLGLEAAWLDELVRSAGANPARVVALGEVIDPVGDPPDPHFWLDPTRVTRAAREITEIFDAASPDPFTGDVSYPVNWYFNNWKVYIQRLADLDFWIRLQLVEVPTERRVLPASLDSLQYFAEQYGFEMAEEGASVPAVPSLQIVSLGERGGGADTYIRMMRTNVEAIAEALK